MLPIAILAGGFATRIKPLSNSIPKSLVEIYEKPFLEWQLQLLEKNNFKRVVICASHRSDMIEDFIANRPKTNLEILFSLDGDKQLGTGGALIKARKLLGKSFLVIYGDSYLPVDFNEVAEYFLESNKPALMTVVRNNFNSEPNNVIFKNGYIQKYDKRNPTEDMQYIDFGLNAFNSDVFNNYPSNEYIELSSIQTTLATRKELIGFQVSQRFYEVGSFDGIKIFQNYLKDQ
jgi:MurNAc alpha-1-phosphate uridylyltransferase